MDGLIDLSGPCRPQTARAIVDLLMRDPSIGTVRPEELSAARRYADARVAARAASREALTPGEADELLALALSVKAEAIARYGSLPRAEQAIGLVAKSLCNACRPDGAHASTQLRLLRLVAEKLAAEVSRG